MVTVFKYAFRNNENYIVYLHRDDLLKIIIVE